MQIHVLHEDNLSRAHKGSTGRERTEKQELALIAQNKKTGSEKKLHYVPANSTKSQIGFWITLGKGTRGIKVKAKKQSFLCALVGKPQLPQRCQIKYHI